VSIAAIGGVLSLPLVMGAVRLFDRLTQDAGRPYYVTYAIDPSVFAVIAAICVAVGIGFGIVPAWHSASADANVSLKDGTGSSSGSRHQQRWMAMMTVSQIALAVILLSGTGLLVRSVPKMYELSVGVATPRVIVMQLPLPGTKYPTSADRLAFMRRVDERLAEVAAIESSSTTSNAPLGGGAAVQFSIDGRQSGTAERAPLVTMIAIGPAISTRSDRRCCAADRSLTSTDCLDEMSPSSMNGSLRCIWLESIPSVTPSSSRRIPRFARSPGPPQHARARTGSGRLRSAARGRAIQSCDAPRAHRAQSGGDDGNAARGNTCP
jgi:hypothetical protein